MASDIHSDLSSLTVTSFDAGLVFSGRKSGTFVKGFSAPSAYTPPIDPDYLFQESARDLIVWFLHDTEPLYIHGPTGAGKTSCVKQLAARLNYPVFEATGHGRLELADLVGHLSVRNGAMEFDYGPLALAMKFGGLFLLNELDLASPDVVTGLNTVLDGSPLCVAENGGELVRPHPMFRFVATGNTSGAGDETGLYSGVLRQNMAFLDRFVLSEVGYPKPKDETALLTRRFPSLPPDLCGRMVAYANEIRALFMGESSKGSQIEVTFSTRSLLRWADLTLRYESLARQGLRPIDYALDRALAFRATRETRAMMHELTQRMFA